MSEAPAGIVTQEERTALERLLRLSFGHFRCVIVRVPLERELELVRWLLALGSQLAAASALAGEGLVLDVGVFGSNFLHGLEIQARELRPGSFLVLTGFEEAQRGAASRRQGPYQQMNVQRDSLVRRFPCPWILLMASEEEQIMSRIAPDFADFVSLRIGREAREELTFRSAVKSRDLPAFGQLAEFLASSIDPQELGRILLAVGETRLGNSLRASSHPSRTQRAYIAVESILRLGLLADLLDALAALRPRQAQELQQIRAAAVREGLLRQERPVLAAMKQLSAASFSELFRRLQPVLRDRDARTWTPETLYEAALQTPGGLTELHRILADIQQDRFA